ncbi:MAG: cobalamin biosynthesis protein CobD [Desulfobacteraceae bacterium]|nr:cobalamin biosynthesis protein CobD [Desulfobacteraceae bacterium]
MDTILWLIPSAFILDLFLGDPVYPFHPVRIIGNRIIVPIERLLRFAKFDGRAGGFILLIFTLLISGGTVFTINYYLKEYSIAYYIFNLYLIYSCIAVKDLRVHVGKVMESLEQDNIEQAREQLGAIVGRETSQLEPEEISRACVETLAENLSDGIIAPLFYAFAGGAPLAVFYKAANTMDSMVGYKNEQYEKFGYFPAKFDDFMNWIPARLSLILVMLAGKKYSQNWTGAWKIAANERHNHTSPNAAHPEAAMAGVLNLRLGGPNYYHGERVEKPYINKHGNPVGPDNVRAAWNIAFSASIIALAVFAAWRLLGCFFI